MMGMWSKNVRIVLLTGDNGDVCAHDEWYDWVDGATIADHEDNHG